MKLLDRLERRFSRYAISNLTKYLIFGQGIIYLAMTAQPNLVESLRLIPSKVLAGEVWRLITFPVMPAVIHPIWFILAMWVFYIVGSAIEQHWGDYRYNVYLLILYIATVAAAFVTPNPLTTNPYFGTSVFVAFAYLFPDFTFLLFFIFPVKVKWLAVLAWIMFAYAFIGGDLATRMVVAASVANFFIFFGPEIVSKLVRKRRRMAVDAETAVEREQAFHTCAGCGATDKTHPSIEFRYLPTTEGTQCMCENCMDQTGQDGALKKP